MSTKDHSFPSTGKVPERSEGGRGAARASAPMFEERAKARATPSDASGDSFPVKGKQLRKIARTLRNNATEHEKWLWTDLRTFKLFGCRFRRQVLIGGYIVDFACYRSRLIVELDGNQHAEPNHAKRDKVRDAWLESQKFQILRFWNSDLHANYDNVLDDIYHTARKRLEIMA